MIFFHNVSTISVILLLVIFCDFLDQSYYAFALIRCGDQVRDTPLYEITSADTDMYFDLTIML